MKDFFGSMAKHLKYPILVFGIALIAIVMTNIGNISKEYQGATLAGGFLLVLIALAIYLAERVDGSIEINEKLVAPISNVERRDTDKAAQADQINQSNTIGYMNIEERKQYKLNYLNSIVADCKRARLVGLDPKAADPTKGAFSLEHLYIQLDTRSLYKIKGSDDKVLEKPLPAVQALVESKERCIVLLGLPGSGKSTFVRYLALQNARLLLQPSLNVTAELPEWASKSLIPVIVPLGRLAESCASDTEKGNAELVENFIKRLAQSNQLENGYENYFFEDIEREGGIFLFDGLDEVADLNKRPIIVEAIEDFTSRYRSNSLNRFLVTCRTFSYTDPRWQLLNWPTFEIALLSEEKIHQFIDAWHSESIRVDPAREDDYKEKRAKLIQALRPDDTRKLWEIADNPLILTVMAVVHGHKGDLPDARALVYEECIDLLLLRWESERTVIGGKQQKRDLRTALDVPEVVLRNALQEIAYHAHDRRGWSDWTIQAALVTEDLLYADLVPAFGSNLEKVKIFIDFCESANGLLLLQGVAPVSNAPLDSPPRRVYAFPHLTFQEYLAARYIRRMPNLGHTVRNHLDKSDRWREVVMLLGEHLCFREGDEQLMDIILTSLAPNPLPPQMSDEDWRALWMAADLLILYRRAFPHKKDAHQQIIVELVKLLRQNALSPRERVSAGNDLSILGDPRFDTSNNYLTKEELFGFVSIPDGPATLGSDGSRDTSAQANEGPLHEVNLPLYYISQFPVTVDQFCSFVNETGYAPLEPSCLQGIGNQPVVNVNFYDCINYCAWLDSLLKKKAKLLVQNTLSDSEKKLWIGLETNSLTVILPSEIEWEKASRGVDGKRFPWGNGFEVGRANIDGIIGKTSVVGCFQSGISQFGVLDTIGNVFEWTRSIYAPYPYIIGVQRENINADKNLPRVLRGGAYEFDKWHGRCATRLAELPTKSSKTFGFRIAIIKSEAQI